MGYKLASALCVQMILIGFVLADETYINSSTISGLTFNMEQNVQGNGFSNSYLNASTLNQSLSNKGHGSGSYSCESLLGIKDGVKYDDLKDEFKSSSDKNIDLNENANFSYAPTNFYLGKSMKWGGFQSLGSEVTCIKNYGSGVSMDVAFDRVSTLSKDVTAGLLLKSTSSVDTDLRTIDFYGKSNLAVNAAFSGKGHIGSLALDNEHDADVLIDEDYLGTYSISKNMTDEFVYKVKQESDEWLPCCSGGYLTMPSTYLGDSKLKGARGVFDCTCFKAPALAEFPRT
jgi:hypothetical protein